MHRANRRVCGSPRIHAELRKADGVRVGRKRVERPTREAGITGLVGVQDVHSRRIVGWSMADHMRTELVTDALQMALAQRRPAPGLIRPLRPGQPVRLARLRRRPAPPVMPYLPFAPRPPTSCSRSSLRYELAWMIVTSTKPLSASREIFGDEAAAAAMIDRLVHQAEIP